VAGPGSGKTAVLALRIARLVEAGIDPASILAITFTVKAAQELRSRIAGAVGEGPARLVAAGTFHSFCLSLLREHSGPAGLPEDFIVMDEEERGAMLLAAAGSDSAARRLGTYVEARKRFLLLPGDLSPRLGPAAPPGLPELAERLGLPAIDSVLDARYSAYRDALRARGALDFDDLVAGAVRLLAYRPDVAQSIRSRFRAVFVDEYQDVNFAQYALVRLLVPDCAPAELIVIGDPNQAIYGFRGADPRFIDRFPEDYPGAAVFRLSRSFRCAPPILGAAGRLVGAELSGTGTAVALSRTAYPTDRSEAEGIAREIDRLIGGTRFFAVDSGVATGRAELGSLSECAVLVRAAALAPAIGKALRDHGIPYRFIGERPWWEEEPAKSIVAALRDRRPELSPVEAVRAAAAELSLLADGSPVETDPESPLRRLLGAAGSFRSLADFLDSLATGSPQDGWESRSESVSLMTIHSSKGLEFDHVFVPGVEEGLLPFTLFGGETAVDEERRLLFVAMTRARIGLHLSCAGTRTFRGRELRLEPSRFLSELADLVPLADSGPRRPKDPQLDLWR
jgi:superfamily I DNA/RNA helicase